MPIIHLGSLSDRNKPDFQVAVKSYKIVTEKDSSWQNIPAGEYFGPFIEYCTYTSHNGLCIRDFERNGYDDSDWFMIVWNEERHEPETILFASTRGWSYPCYGSRPDANTETLAAYAQYQDAESRLFAMRDFKSKIAALCEFRDTAKIIAHAAGVPVGKVLKLRKVLGKEKIENLASFFGPRVRSNFKINLRTQLVNWLNDSAPKYPTPFSRKQLEWI